METLPPNALDPPKPLVGVTLIEGPDFQWPCNPSSNISQITSCPALSFLKAIDSAATTSNSTVSSLQPPLRTISLRKNSSLPPRKHSRESSETRRWYEPVGIFRMGWYRKHLTELPSVVVCPVQFEPYTDEEQWGSMERSIETIYGQARGQLNGRHCRLVMLCVVLRDYSIDRETKDRLHVASDRVSSLRKHLGLEKSQVQLIYTADMLPTSTTMQKIYKTLHGYASEYYKFSSKLTREHKRGVDSRSGLSFCGQLIMTVRHNLKTSIFYEFRGTPLKALRHLDVCYGKLIDLQKVYEKNIIATGKATGITVEELKMVASLVNYNICRLNFSLSKGIDAMEQFQKHVSAFRHLKSIVPCMKVLQVGTGLNEVEHPISIYYSLMKWKWLGNQHEIFSALLTHSQKNNIPLNIFKKKSKNDDNNLPLLTQYNHLSNAILAHRRSYTLLNVLKRNVSLWGGVGLNIEDSKRILNSLYIGGICTYDNVAPSLYIEKGKPQDHGFEQVHKSMMYKILREKIMEEEEVNSSDGSLEKIKNETEYENNDTDSSSTANHYLQLIKKCLGIMRQEFNMNDTRGSRRAQSMNIIMSEFLIQLKRYQDAINILLPVLNIFQKERWPSLLKRCLIMLKFCSLKLNQLDHELLYGLQLLSNETLSIDTKLKIHNEFIVFNNEIENDSTIYLTHDMSSSSDISSLLNVNVFFQRNVVQIKDSVNMELTIKSNFPNEISLNYIILQLDDQFQLHRRTSLSNDTTSMKGDNGGDSGSSSSFSPLSYVCVIIKKGQDLSSILKRMMISYGRQPDIIIEKETIIIHQSKPLSFLMDLMMDVPLPLASEATSSTMEFMPKHGTVIFPVAVTAGITCTKNRNVDLTIDLEHCRLSCTADALSRADAYAADEKRMFSLLRPTLNDRRNTKDGKHGDFGQFRFTRLIPPLSSVDIAIRRQDETNKIISFNDWHPIDIIVSMVENIDSADGLELTMWLSNKTKKTKNNDGSTIGGDSDGNCYNNNSESDLSEIQVMNNDTKVYSLYDPHSNPVIALGSLQSKNTITVSICIRFNRNGIPKFDEKHALNISIFHKTSCGWPATKHFASTVHVQSPFTMKLTALPTTKMTGQVSIDAHSKVIVGETLVLSSLITNQINSMNIHNIIYKPTYDMNAGTMSELILDQEDGKDQNIQNDQNIQMNRLEELTKCFLIRPLLTTVGNSATSSTTLGSVIVQWSTPLIQKPSNLIYNETIVPLKPIQIADIDSVTSYIIAPKKCLVGKGFQFTLVTSNRGKNIVPVSFNIELGSNFFCTGRTKGNHVVQPLSFTKTIFYLIGVVPGHLTLPKINIETDGGEQLITSNNMGQIFCHP